MKYIDWESEYNRYPETAIHGYDGHACSGWEHIIPVIDEAMAGKKVLTVDCYPGVDDGEVRRMLKEGLKPQLVIDTKDMFYDGQKLTELMWFHLTDDRVRGIMYYGEITDFIDGDRLREMKRLARQSDGTVLVYGFGAALVTKGDILVYADMTRWEIQLRYRKGMPNYKQENRDEDFLRKYKRGFFVEWRIADKHKVSLYGDIDFYLDTNTENHPNMVTGEAFFAGLDALTRQPFSLVPYFDPGVWGGQWMKEVCRLDKDEWNYAWCFNGVPEENCIYLRYGDVRIQSPAMNLTLGRPREFLGEKNFARFGAEFPIRFDFLDTMGGQNLSLQVHPLTEYIHKKFGMPYTQDESYYILDAGEDGGVYLGLKEDVDGSKMIGDLEAAQNGTNPFDAEKYVNLFPAKKHDHFLIPAGTVHCSARDCMVLEVSATPYIFTFKLWDWDRVGLDGLPRPIHIEDGKKVIRFDRTTSWVKENLINRFEILAQNREFIEVKTGLHELEFIETHVITTERCARIASDGEFAMLTLVDGRAALVESPAGAFPPYKVNYAETFVMPASAGDYAVRPYLDGEAIKVLKANVRF